jgi:hypothetical protein
MVCRRPRHRCRTRGVGGLRLAVARSPTAAPWVSGRRLHSPWSRLHRGGGCPSRLPKQQMLSGIILNENGPWSAGAVSFGVVSHRVCKCAVPVFGTGLNMVGTGSFLKTERPPERCSPIALTFGLFFVLAVAPTCVRSCRALYGTPPCTRGRSNRSCGRNRDHIRYRKRPTGPYRFRLSKGQRMRVK